MTWLQLTSKERIDVLQHVSQVYRILINAVEKDWWVTRVLQALFASDYSDQLVFKGGTSLSKGWNAINRFSEDIDIGLNREFPGFSGTLSKTQISDKLRRVSKKIVDAGLMDQGIDSTDYTIYTKDTSISTTDPRKIY